jgi:hypothetical protein
MNEVIMNRLTAILVFCCLLLTALNAVPRDKVIVEIATGTWCQYCPGAAMGADDLVENGHQVAIIENHNGDAFATTASNARNSYYNVSGFPTAWFDGGNPYVGGSTTVSQYSFYLPRVNSRLAVNSHFTINALGTFDNGTYSVNVSLNKVEPDTNTNLILHAVVTESDILVNWQGQTHLNYVNRMMIPSQSGTSVSFSSGNSQTIPLTFTMNSSWVLANCEVVFFLQNNTTKEILQGTKYSFPELISENMTSVTDISFPVTYLTTTQTIPFTLTNNHSNAMTGTIAIDNPAFTLNPATRLNYNIVPYGSASYNVTFTPTSSSTQSAVITITTNMYYDPVISIPVTATGDYAPPKAPENISIFMNGNNAVLNWEIVTENVLNVPLVPSRYLIYSNSTGEPYGQYSLIGLTINPPFTNMNVGSSIAEKYYRIVAFKSYARDGADPTDLLRPGMTEAETNAILNAAKAKN